MKIDGIESVEINYKDKTATCQLKSDVKDVAAVKKALADGLSGKYKVAGTK